jgi:hypothetical protein
MSNGDYVNRRLGQLQHLFNALDYKNKLTIGEE